MRDDQVSYLTNKAAHQVMISPVPGLPTDVTEKALIAVRVIWHTAGCLKQLRDGEAGV